jgi:hypothetical protein
MEGFERALLGGSLPATVRRPVAAPDHGVQLGARSWNGRTLEAVPRRQRDRRRRACAPLPPPTTAEVAELPVMIVRRLTDRPAGRQDSR